MIEKTCYFFNVGTTFDKNNKDSLKGCWNCNQFCCKADLCNGLWCEEYGIYFNKKEALNFINEYVKNGVESTYGFIKSVDINLPKELWDNIYESTKREYNFPSINEAKEKGFISYDFTDVLEDYSSYWEEPDISFMKVKNKIVKNHLHILKENGLNSDTINWINKELYGIEKDDIEIGV